MKTNAPNLTKHNTRPRVNCYQYAKRGDRIHNLQFKQSVVATSFFVATLTHEAVVSPGITMSLPAGFIENTDNAATAIEEPFKHADPTVQLTLGEALWLMHPNDSLRIGDQSKLFRVLSRKVVAEDSTQTATVEISFEEIL